MKKWDNQNNALRNQQKEIEKTMSVDEYNQHLESKKKKESGQSLSDEETYFLSEKYA
jgi:hypothetical protein